MAIRFCTEIHYITRDNVDMQQLDATAFRAFLKFTHHSFDKLRRILSTEMSHCRSTEAYTQLQTLSYIAQRGYTALKTSLRAKTTNELFSMAEEAESVLRYITSTALTLSHTEQFTAEIQHTQECLNNHCKLVLSKMDCELNSRMPSTVQ